MRVWKNFAVAVVGLVLVLCITAPRLGRAQGTVEDVIFTQVASNLGLFPAPTKGQLDLGTLDYPFPFRYRSQALDLNPSQGAVTCDARILADGEVLRGWYGFRITVNVSGREYVYRTNSSGTQVIRCVDGKIVSNSFGAAPSRGRLINGEEAVNVALRHLSGYLALNPVLTLAEFERVNTARRNREDVKPYALTSYRWDPVIFSNSALNCPAAGGTFQNGDAAGYRISLTINGRFYSYRLSPDGAVVILCLNGRADPSSLGVNQGG